MSIFQNYNELVGNYDSDTRASVLTILESGVKAVLPENSMKEFFEKVGEKISKRITIIGWGKASVGMYNTFLEHYHGEIQNGCIIAQKDDESKFNKGTMEISYGAHPIPDESSLISGEKLFQIAQDLDEDDTLVCLISGGGSSMFEVPKEGIELEDLRRTYNLLLKSGADIHEMNSIRRAISKNKGGGLAKSAYPARILNIIISDVPGNNLEDISSGPTVMDPKRVDPTDVLKIYRLEDKLDMDILNSIHNYKPIPEKYFRNLNTYIIADNIKAVKAMMNKAVLMGYAPTVFPEHLRGEARDAVISFMKTKGDLILGGGETSVTVKGVGRGGRNQEFVLAGLRNIGFGTLASMGTDGIDGNTDSAGAIGDQILLKEVEARNYNIDSFLQNNNSYEYFDKIGGLLKTGPTGTNVADISVLLR